MVAGAAGATGRSVTFMRVSLGLEKRDVKSCFSIDSPRSAHYRSGTARVPVVCRPAPQRSRHPDPSEPSQPQEEP